MKTPFCVGMEEIVHTESVAPAQTTIIRQKHPSIRKEFCHQRHACYQDDQLRRAQAQADRIVCIRSSLCLPFCSSRRGGVAVSGDRPDCVLQSLRPWPIRVGRDIGRTNCSQHVRYRSVRQLIRLRVSISSFSAAVGYWRTTPTRSSAIRRTANTQKTLPICPTV